MAKIIIDPDDYIWDPNLDLNFGFLDPGLALDLEWMRTEACQLQAIKAGSANCQPRRIKG